MSQISSAMAGEGVFSVSCWKCTSLSPRVTAATHPPSSSHTETASGARGRHAAETAYEVTSPCQYCGARLAGKTTAWSSASLPSRATSCQENEVVSRVRPAKPRNSSWVKTRSANKPGSSAGTQTAREKARRTGTAMSPPGEGLRPAISDASPAMVQAAPSPCSHFCHPAAAGRKMARRGCRGVFIFPPIAGKWFHPRRHPMRPPRRSIGNARPRCRGYQFF